MLKIILIFSSFQRDTFYFDNNLQQWKKGPLMAKARGSHGCGSFLVENKLVLIVAGSQSSDFQTSVEFLVPSDNEPKWITGKK